MKFLSLKTDLSGLPIEGRSNYWLLTKVKLELLSEFDAGLKCIGTWLVKSGWHSLLLREYVSHQQYQTHIDTALHCAFECEHYADAYIDKDARLCSLMSWLCSDVLDDRWVYESRLSTYSSSYQSLYCYLRSLCQWMWNLRWWILSKLCQSLPRCHWRVLPGCYSYRYCLVCSIVLLTHCKTR